MQLVRPKLGKYVVAVSGGVDSVALLDMLTRYEDLELIVAHFDHGIRPDSAADVEFVAQLAARYGLFFETKRVELGPQASEAAARTARYDFLHSVRDRYEALAIITAHHQDDVLETAIMNILRGTGRRGLTSLQNTETVVRPLLNTPKSELEQYAIKQQLSWREDTTNHDERYTRNYIRHRLLVNFDANARQQLLTLISRQSDVNAEIDTVLSKLMNNTGTEMDRRWFNGLSHDVATEVMASWLRANHVADFDRPGIERLTMQAKTQPAGKRIDVLHGSHLQIGKDTLALKTLER